MRAISGVRIERGMPAVAASLAGVALAALALGCPIQRPPLPRDYIPFRDALRDSVAERTHAELTGRPATEGRLRERLASLATIAQTDSLLVALQSDAALRPLADPVAETLAVLLVSDVADGGVRKAFQKPEGQRLAVDAVLIGFGNALRRLEVERRG